MQDHKVIGYVAAMPRHQFFAESGSLLVTGNEDTLKACIVSRFKRSSILNRYEYRKVRYRDLEQLLARGISLVLDRTAFNRFGEIAVDAGRKFQMPAFDQNQKYAISGIEVVRIRPNPAKLKTPPPAPPKGPFSIHRFSPRINPSEKNDYGETARSLQTNIGLMPEPKQ